MQEQKINIYLKDMHVGDLYTSFLNGKNVYSFEYDPAWLKNHKYFMLDPQIAPYTGRQYPQDSSKLFGIFSDCCPDRWGKMLIRRREQFDAKRENREPRDFSEIDFMLNVSDYNRTGAFRFTLDKGETYISTKKPDIPPIKYIRELQNASLNFAENDEALNLLLSPGSSLGGARPKASVSDTDGSLWIAKFPSKQDSVDIGAWEKVTHDLAKMCDIKVEESKLLKLSKYGSTFLTKRFDRKGEDRIHFASAMTMLNKQDGEDDVSYLDIVSWIFANCENVKANTVELFKRVVFNCAVSNFDDHLRNHAFLYKDNSWDLSPAYDMNPVPYGDMLSLNITELSNIVSRSNIIKSAQFYGLSESSANDVISKILNTVSNNWRLLAHDYKIPQSQIEYMRTAFELL